MYSRCVVLDERAIGCEHANHQPTLFAQHGGVRDNRIICSALRQRIGDERESTTGDLAGARDLGEKVPRDETDKGEPGSKAGGGTG